MVCVARRWSPWWAPPVRGEKQTMNYSKNIFVLSAALALAAGATLGDTVTIATDTVTTTGYSGTSDNPFVVNFVGGRIVISSGAPRILGAYATFVGDSQHPICIRYTNYARMTIGADGGTAATDGNCDFILEGPDDPGSFTDVWTGHPLVYIDKPVTWGNSGDFVSDNIPVVLASENVMPCGPGRGGVRLSTKSWAAANRFIAGQLDLRLKSQCVNWLDASNRGMVTNTHSTYATLTFGTGDVAGYVKGPIGGNIHVKKTGNAAFTLHDSSMPDLTVEDGSISVVGTSTVGPLTARTGANITIEDGGTLKADSFATTLAPVTAEATYFFGDGGSGSIASVIDFAGADDAVPITIANGGTLEFGSSADTVVERVAITNSGTIRKIGAGSCTISSAEAQKLGGTINVADGLLGFAGVGNTNEWWKIVVTKVANANGRLRFGQFGLFDINGNKLWTSMRVTEGATVSALAPGNATYATPSGWSYENDKTPSEIFTGNHWNYLQIAGMAAQQDQSAQPFEVAFRLPAGANPAAYFAISALDGNGPKEFHVETSPTGADGTWTTVGNGTASMPDWNHYYYWLGDGTWGGICGMPWKINSNAPANVDVSGATLKVNAGATLDLTGSHGDIAAIEVDWTSLGGTIRGLAIPANGTLALVNVPAGTDVLGPTLLSFPAATGTANVKSWTVTVNGTGKDCRIQIDANGALTLAAKSTVILMR